MGNLNQAIVLLRIFRKGGEEEVGRNEVSAREADACAALKSRRGCQVDEGVPHDIVAFVKSQGQPQYLQEVVNLRPEDLEDLKSNSSANSDDADEFFEEARDLIIQTKVASISYIQRKLRIGYNRAARIMEQLEEAGVVSSPDGDGKNRKVII